MTGVEPHKSFRASLSGLCLCPLLEFKEVCTQEREGPCRPPHPWHSRYLGWIIFCCMGDWAHLYAAGCSAASLAIPPQDTSSTSSSLQLWQQKTSPDIAPVLWWENLPWMRTLVWEVETLRSWAWTGEGMRKQTQNRVGLGNRQREFRPGGTWPDGCRSGDQSLRVCGTEAREEWGEWQDLLLPENRTCTRCIPSPGVRVSGKSECIWPSWCQKEPWKALCASQCNESARDSPSWKHCCQMFNPDLSRSLGNTADRRAK